MRELSTVSKEGLLDRKTILRAFEALSKDLATRGIKGELFVVGGAAIVLAYNSRRTTRDVGAIFEPKIIIYEASLSIAAELGLPDDWLNDAAKAYAPGDDLNKQLVFQSPNLQVTAGSAEYVLAMKLLASRVDRDTEDIQTLYKILGYETADQGLALIERFYPRGRIEPKTQFLLEELFGSASHRGPLAE
jgi:hypothetical protein